MLVKLTATAVFWPLILPCLNAKAPVGGASESQRTGELLVLRVSNATHLSPEVVPKVESYAYAITTFFLQGHLKTLGSFTKLRRSLAKLRAVPLLGYL